MFGDEYELPCREDFYGEDETAQADRPQEDPDNYLDEGEEFFSEKDEHIILIDNKVAIAQMLLRKSKKCAAKYLKEEYIRNKETLEKNAPPNLVLTELLDIILNPSLSLNNPETMKWLKWLLASGMTPRDFYKQVEQFDNPTTCSLVWTADFMAYRCRTCGISPCMSLCLECFHKGNHKGHDYNMFKSQAGGACDCGNHAVMAETGFCKRHNSSRPVSVSEPPPDLLNLSKAIMPRLLLRFILHCRDHGNSPMSTIQVGMAEVELFIAFLQELCCRGAAMRNIMTESFCNPKIYKNYTEHRPGSRYFEEMVLSKSLYLEALESIPFGEVPEGYEDISTLHGPLVHKTFLEEIVFWTLKFEFPQKLVCLLLNMRPDSTYEDAFARAFVQHYSRISVMLVKSTDTDTLSHRVVHVSVQLFSDHNLAYRMTDSYHLLHVMVLSLKKMMKAICVPSTLRERSRNTHKVVNCIHQVMKNHCYWPLVSDLNNILSHKPIAEKFMTDSRLMQEWFSFLSLFQGMNNNIRELTQHVDYEPHSYYASFSAELEASASPLWAMISHLKDAETKEFSITVMKHCLQELSIWFKEIGFCQPERVHYNEASFHLPLHRNFALLLCQAVKKQGVKLEEILPSTDFLSTMLVHPLRAQVAFYQILCDLWVRNGLQIKGQAMTYIQCHFCNSMVDPDIFLLQVGAGEMPKDVFLLSIFERFNALEYLYFSKPSGIASVDSEHKIQMLESCLTFLATITTNRHNIGLGEEEIALLELMPLICMGDKTHSQLLEHVPEKCSGCSTIDFESILVKITKYCKPECERSGNMKQGTYVPLDHVWEDLFDPIFALLRTLHKKDFQNSLNRFKNYCRESGKVSKRTASRLWPPYRLPSPVNSSYKDPRRVLACRTFHGLLLVLLYKAVHEYSFPENLMALAVYLLELTIDYQAKTEDKEERVLAAQSNPTNHSKHNRECPDGGFYLWYDSDDILINTTVLIDRILLKNSLSIMTASEGEGSDIEMVEIEGIEPYLCLPSTSASDSSSAQQLLSGSELVPYQHENFVVTSDGNGSAAVSWLNEQMEQANESIPLPIGSNVQYPSLISGTEVARVVHQSRDVESRTTSLYHPRPRRQTGVGLYRSASGSSSSALLPSSLSSQLGNALVESSSRLDESSQALNVSQFSSNICDDSSEEYVIIKESIITLLLKLHTKLTGRKGSYRAQFYPQGADSRIGDGPFFIAKVLNKLGQLNEGAKKCILETQSRLYPNLEEEVSTSSEEEANSKNREDKKRKARERQKKVMEAFARKQRKFLAKNWCPSDDGDNAMLMAAQQRSNNIREYDCVICNQSIPSTHERPVGLVILLQATSILAHRTASYNDFELPISDRTRARLRLQRFPLGRFMEEKAEILSRYFDLHSWLASMDIGWEGGVHMQTCGHYLHLDCHRSYLLSLRSHPKDLPNPMNYDKGEYCCPFCRQMANSVLPICSEIGEGMALVQHNSRTGDFVGDIDDALKNLAVPNYSSRLSSAAACVMEDMTIIAPAKHRTVSCLKSPSSSSLFMFVSSIFRTNLETELVQLGGSLVSQPGEPKIELRRSCIMPLLNILAYHAKILNVGGNKVPGEPPLRSPNWIRQVWSSLSQRSIVGFEGAVTLHEREVPMLFRDPITMLLHLVLLLPSKIDNAYYKCIVLHIYRFVVVRAAIAALRALNEKQREKAITNGSLAPLLAMSYNYLRDSPFFCDDEPPSSNNDQTWSISELNFEVRDICVSFLRIASLLKFHMMEEELPDIADPLAECATLERYLDLWNTCSVVNNYVMGKMCGSLIASNSPSVNVNSVVSPSGGPVETQLGELSGAMKTWCSEVALFASKAQVQAASLLSNARFYQPCLLRLPATYDELFQYYHQKRCPHCNCVPKDPGLCLICGTLLCLRQPCCNQNNVYEASQHAFDCGAGTAIFLAILQSTIVVVRDVRIAKWGCIHLDLYGEEDRELKRGKPLFLCKIRYRLLEEQWINHSFNHTSHTWLWHRDRF